MEKILFDGVRKLRLKDEEGKLVRLLLLYAKEIKLFNAAFNLVNAKNDKDLAVSHILDSLAARHFFEAEIQKQIAGSGGTVRIADAGSGAGFPGVPLAASFLYENTGVRFTLIERMQKRCGFLTNVKAVLHLHNTEILQSEVQNAPAAFFDIVTCRAFSPLNNTILHTLLRCTKPEGCLFLYKANLEKLKIEAAAAEKCGLAFRVEPLHVPFLQKERNLLIIKKKGEWKNQNAQD